MKHKPKASPKVPKAPWYGETKFHLYYEDKRELIFKYDSTNTESTQEEKESNLPKQKETILTTPEALCFSRCFAAGH